MERSLKQMHKRRRFHPHLAAMKMERRGICNLPIISLFCPSDPVTTSPVTAVPAALSSPVLPSVAAVTNTDGTPSIPLVPTVIASIPSVILPTTTILPSTTLLTSIIPSSTLLVTSTPSSTSLPAPSSATATNTRAAASDTSNTKSSSHVSAVAIVIPVLVVLLAIGALVGYIVYVKKRNRKRRGLAQKHISWSDLTGVKRQNSILDNGGNGSMVQVSSPLPSLYGAPAQDWASSQNGASPQDWSPSPYEAKSNQVENYSYFHAPTPHQSYYGVQSYPENRIDSYDNHRTSQPLPNSNRNSSLPALPIRSSMLPAVPEEATYRKRHSSLPGVPPLSPNPSNRNSTLPSLPETYNRSSYLPAPPLPTKDSSPWSNQSRLSVLSTAPSMSSAYGGLNYSNRSSDIPPLPTQYQQAAQKDGEDVTYNFLSSFLDESQSRRSSAATQYRS